MINNSKKVLGLMSGTSMDGLDMCLANISLKKDYSFIYEIIDFNYEEFDINTIDLIKKTLNDNKYLNDLDAHIGKLFSNIVRKYYSKGDMDIISMHGQTVKHIDGVQSIQSGDPKFLYNQFKVPIIYNFRNSDIIKGGNGAPLMPFLDWLLFRDEVHDVITLNIGGISNISHIRTKSKRSDVMGFDTGPGMSLIDEFIFLKWKHRYDKDGLLAAKGKINSKLLSFLMKHEYIRKNPPKSTGRDVFGLNMINSIINNFQNLDNLDILRTLVRFTAKSIIVNLEYLKNFSEHKSILIISGGGINNKLLIDDIKELSNFNDIISSSEIGINPDYKESLLMSVLGLGRIMKLHTNIPSVTGANQFVSCGDIYG